MGTGRKLGESGRNRVDLGGIGWIWEELGGTGRKLGEFGRNWVDLGGTWWIWEELGGNWEETR